MGVNFDKLLDELLSKGAALAGVADIACLPDDEKQGYRFAVSIGIALNRDVVRGIPTGPHPDYENEYADVNKALDELALFAEQRLVEQGEDAFAVTGKRAPYQRDTCKTTLPHKTAARLAGHGWIGKCALLITPKYGSAVRFTTVLTNAPFTRFLPLIENRCGNCRRCAEACPGGAISGKTWELGVSRDEMVSTEACQNTFRIRSLQSGQKNGTCGLCIAACPYTLRYISKTNE